jgi:voltage-gated potassium channel
VDAPATKAQPAPPKSAARPVRQRGNAYSIFILVLTIQSLAIMVLLLLPFAGPINDALLVWDNVICGIFLIDFALNLATSHPRREYFFGRLGWLDLIGSIPTLGVFKFTALFRLARVARLLRLSRMLGKQGRRELLLDVIHNRGQYALFITVLLAFIVLTTSSVLVLLFEADAVGSNITTGGVALWWSIVTITTVGYGDHYPVTALGRLIAVVVMFSGIGIIGALASILATLLTSPRVEEAAMSQVGPEEDAPASTGDEQPSSAAPMAAYAGAHQDSLTPLDTVLAALDQTQQELARTRAELADMRTVIHALSQGSGGAGAAPAGGPAAAPGDVSR